MKKSILILTAIIFALTTSLVAQETAKPEKKKNKKISEVSLVCKMDCEKCANDVKKQLAFTKGVKVVETDHENNTIFIKYRNDKTDPVKIIASLAEIDYKATVKKSCCPSKAKSSGCSSKTEKTGCGGSSSHSGCGGTGH